METKKKENIFRSMRRYFQWYFNLTDSLENKESVIESIKEGVSFRGTNILILITAMFIASLGLNVNSTAVIIGAMLISPLMGPIMGMGLGIGIHDFPLIKRSLRNLAMAALFSIIASTIYFLLSPLNEERSELLARTSPSIYDVLIAFFGGFAGILGATSKQKGNVVPGVAIATALMPPLCTAGYGLATWQWSYFLGAFYLFLINSIFIGTATALGVHLFRFPRVKINDTNRAKRVNRIVYAIIVLTIIPSVYLTVVMLKESRFVATANAFVDKEFVFPNTQVIRRSAIVDDGRKVVKVSLIGEKLPLDSLKVAMYTKLNEAGLEGVDLEISQGFTQGEVDINKLSSQMFGEIFTSNQKKLETQTQEIDSLRTVLNTGNLLSKSIVAELKVLFPQVEAFSISRNVFARQSDTTESTSVNIAIVTLNSPLPAAQEEKMLKFLEARSGLKNIVLMKYSSAIPFPADSISE